MPNAICNICEELVPIDGSIRNAACKCGSKDLSIVAVKWNPNREGYNCIDRTGKVRKFIPETIKYE